MEPSRQQTSSFASARRLFVGVVALVATMSAPASGADADSRRVAALDEAARISLLSDAASRSSLNASAGNAGYKSGFFVDSDDGRFRLNTRLTIQFRYMAALDLDQPNGQSTTSGFQFRRTRLDIRGHVVTEKLSFRIQADFARSGGELRLTDGYVDYELDDSVAIRFGQANLPFDREQNSTSNTTLPHLERSLVNDVFEVERSQQIQLQYRAERVRVSVAVSDGARGSNTAFGADREADTAVTARVQLRLGEAGWSQWRDFQGFRGDAPGVLLAAGVHWQEDGLTFSETGGGRMLAYTADVGYEDSGWYVTAILNGRSIEDPVLGTLNDLGAVVQGGFFVTEQVEVAARAAWVFPSDDRTEPDDTFAAYTGTVGWYAWPGSTTFRLLAEVTVYPDTQADSSSIVGSSSSRGQLQDTSGGQVVLGFGAQLKL